MITGAALVAITLIRLTGPDRQQIELNPEQVVALREPRKNEKEHFAPGVNCLVYTSDGHFIGVMESCDQVRDRLREADRK